MARHEQPGTDSAFAEIASAESDPVTAAIARGITEPVSLDEFGTDQTDVMHLTQMSGETLERWASELSVAEARVVISRLRSIRDEHHTRANATIPIENLIRATLRDGAEWMNDDDDKPAPSRHRLGGTP